jgi:hypothetical protein
MQPRQTDLDASQQLAQHFPALSLSYSLDDFGYLLLDKRLESGLNVMG